VLVPVWVTPRGGLDGIGTFTLFVVSVRAAAVSVLSVIGSLKVTTSGEPVVPTGVVRVVWPVIATDVTVMGTVEVSVALLLIDSVAPPAPASRVRDSSGSRARSGTGGGALGPDDPALARIGSTREGVNAGSTSV
jgi:hypothetical protein